MLEQNKKLISYNLTDAEIMELYNKKYNLTEFDIYKYITAYDYIMDSLGCTKYTLTEGITSNKQKYDNILVSLFYKHIPSDIIHNYPLSIVFNIKQEGQEIKDLTKQDIKNNKLNSPYLGSEFDIEYWDEGNTYSQWYEEYKEYKYAYSNYAGNSYTYYIFKQLIKLFLTEVYLYKHQGFVYTHKELLSFYLTSTLNHPKPYQMCSLSDFIEDKGIEKVKYQCIKVLEPLDINYDTISDLKIKLIDVNTKGDLIQMYDSIVEKKFESFWDYAESRLNSEFIITNKF